MTALFAFGLLGATITADSLAARVVLGATAAVLFVAVLLEEGHR